MLAPEEKSMRRKSDWDFGRFERQQFTAMFALLKKLWKTANDVISYICCVKP